MSNSLKFNKNGDIGSRFDNCLKKCYKILISQNYSSAIEILNNGICDIYILGKDSEIEVERNMAAIMIVQLKGMIDYFNLAIKTSVEEWGKNNKETETIWEILCDCIERLEYSSKYLRSGFVNYIFERLEPLVHDFKENLGQGVYASVEILSDSKQCNICNNDVRACLHIEREIYNGTICQYKFVRPEVRAVSIVESPKDPRCRMWPWNMSEDNKVSMRFASFENIFTFLDELKTVCNKQ